MAGKKVVVIGLDGATWDLIRSLADEELPTFKELMVEGVWENLKSTIPPTMVTKRWG